MKSRLSLCALAAVLACSVNANVADEARKPNTLTKAEKQAGWRLLFDGRTTTGWRGYKMEKMPPGWQAIDGALVRVSGGAGGKGAGGGDDIVTTEEFENFDLQLEWKVLKNGNSGVLYHVSEEPVTAWHYAPEVQLLDNSTHPTRDKRQLAGACYDLYAPSKDVTKPFGQWNQIRILVNGAHVEHWMNGEKILEYELWSDDWKQRVSSSKHKGRPKFGAFKKGPICLQDHTDRIEFRNVKIRPLPAKEVKTGAVAPPATSAPPPVTQAASAARPQAPWPPADGRLRVIIDTDAACEVDDQHALAMALAFPERLQIEGIVASHFGVGGPDSIDSADSIDRSVADIEEILRRAGLDGKIPVKRGFERLRLSKRRSILDRALAENRSADGVDFIIRTALTATPEDPLWLVVLGGATDAVVALEREPRITDRLVVFWHIRSSWPVECKNTNALHDPLAARALLRRPWRVVLFDTSTIRPISIEESQREIAPTGPLGEFLHSIRQRLPVYRAPRSMMDTGDIAVLLDPRTAAWERTAAPDVDEEMRYDFGRTFGDVVRIHGVEPDAPPRLLYESLRRIQTRAERR